MSTKITEKFIFENRETIMRIMFDRDFDYSKYYSDDYCFDCDEKGYFFHEALMIFTENRNFCKTIFFEFTQDFDGVDFQYVSDLERLKEIISEELEKYKVIVGSKTEDDMVLDLPCTDTLITNDETTRIEQYSKFIKEQKK